MKTIVLLAGLVAVALAGSAHILPEVETKPVDQEYVTRQKLILELLDNITQVNTLHDYYKIAKEYDIEANIENYTNKKAVEEFLHLYKHRNIPMGTIFTVFNDRMREEAIALYHVFHYAKDFETFYKTAAWARVHVNEGLFVYSFSIAVKHRFDTHHLVLSPPYEIYPYLFVNADVVNRVRRIKMQEGVIRPDIAAKYGIEINENNYTIVANYTGWNYYDNDEQKLSYFTEDISLNTFYYYFHTSYPFWMNGKDYDNPIIRLFKVRRGEFFYYFYQQLLARYYMNRLTSGLGEILTLSWRKLVKTGYTPNILTHSLYPFVSRNNDYQLHNHENVNNLQFLESFEEQFLEYLNEGYYKDNKKEVNFKSSDAVEFVGQYWEANSALLENVGNKNYVKYYEIIARVLLGASSENTNEYYATPVALEQSASALRDPVFYQLYKRIIYYFLQYKKYLEPYTTENLKFTGVKINTVYIDELFTKFEPFVFDVSNIVQRNHEELKDTQFAYKVVQYRLNNKPFNVNIEVNADVATDAIFKIFLGPKYDGSGHPISLEDNWMNFVELDWFKQKLTPGKNDVFRKSEDFMFYKDDLVSIPELYKYLEQGKVPKDMAEKFFSLPRRLMLPKGTQGGFQFQIFVIVYPYVQTEINESGISYELGNEPFGYPFDRPVNEVYFNQPNMYFTDVQIYH